MRRLLACLAVLGLVAGACSDDNNDGDAVEANTDSGSDTGGDVPEAMGIDGKTIKIVFTVKEEPCGDSETTAAQDVLNDGGRSALAEFVTFFNDEVLADTGYTLEHELVDDGGIYCPEKARAAGRRIVEEIKPFAVIGPSQNLDQGPIVADMVTEAGIRHIGLSWNTIENIRSRSPLVFPITQTAEGAMVDLVGYIEKRVMGTPGHDPATREEVDERHWGYVSIDLPEYHDIGENVASAMGEIGLELEQQYFLSPDPTIGAQNAATLVNKMASDGVNSIIFDFFNLAGALSGSELTKAMAAQNYRPDIYVGTKGLAAIFGPLWEPTVWEHTEGISTFSPLALRAAIVANPDGTYGYDPAYENVNENADPVVATWKHLGHTDDINVAAAPSMHNYFFGMGILSLGLLHAGDELTAESWAEGLWSTGVGGENRCDMARFYGGTDEEHVPNVSYTEGDHDGPFDEFTTVHWVSEPTDLGLPGIWESYDNYTYFADASEIPDEPTHDTSEIAPDLPLVEKVGLNAWTTCEEVGLE